MTASLHPIQHQRMIERLGRLYNSIYSEQYREEILSRIEWHVQEYLAKTGKLPE